MTAWHYSINYGPDGEANYANVHAADGQFVGNLRTHHAIAICNAFAVCEKLAATPSSPVSAPSPAGGVREALAIAKKALERISAVTASPISVARHALTGVDAVLSSPATPEPVSAPANGEVVEAAAKLVEQMLEQEPYRKWPQARMSLAIAARAIRRGRHLTEAEKAANLMSAIFDEGEA